MYIHQQENWPQFYWDRDRINAKLITVRHNQGLILGKMGALGFSLREQAMLETLTLDVLKTSEIEGEILNPEQVRSSLSRKLGVDIGGLVASDRNTDGIVEMMLDATQGFEAKLTAKRLLEWHKALFPTDNDLSPSMQIGNWRDDIKGLMQVISGAFGKEIVHFEAPAANRISHEINKFIDWFNKIDDTDPVLKAGIAHLWFVTIHPFEDGNGRIARAIADMQLTRADGIVQRFYSMSAQIRLERKQYYDMLEQTQKHTLDISNWLLWFLDCLDRTFMATQSTLEVVLRKARFWEKTAGLNINERQRKMLNKLLDGFEGKLISSKWSIMTKCSQDTALRDIQDLINKDILVKEPSGGRSTSYILKELAQ
jgi:Fic family protein